jgi:hypothetical protein
MATWQYYNDTLKVGGTANKQTDKTFYVDSYKGNDTNVGSYLAPYKSLQKVLDECASTGNGGAIGDVDIIATGYFQEGDFLNKRFRISLIAEGRLTIKATYHNEFILNTPSTTGYTSFNFDFHSGKKKRDYGRITFKDFPQTISFGTIAYGVDVNEKHGCCNVTFKNCFKIINGGIGQIGLVEGCVFDFPVGASNMIMGSYYQPLCFVQKNIFTGAAVTVTLTSSTFTPTFRDNFVNTNVKLSLTASVYNNHIYGEGITGKVNGYTSRDLLNAAAPTFDVNGKSSAIAPLFNTVLNADDYTYQYGAPNAVGGHDGKQIGVYGMAQGGVNTDDVEWTIDANATKGTGEIYQSAGSVAIASMLVGSRFADEDRRIKRVTIPGSIVDYNNGYTIDTTRSADEASPAIETVELAVSSDSTDGTDGTWTGWITVPLEGVPYVDGAGKGNGDPAFNPATKARIIGQWIRYKITLRNNEIGLPLP